MNWNQIKKIQQWHNKKYDHKLRPEIKFRHITRKYLKKKHLKELPK